MANLTDEQIKSCFDLFDADSSGAIDSDELGLVMQGLGFGVLTKEEVDALLKDIDTDANGQIEYSEFRKMCKSKMATRDSPDEVLKAFKVFDEEGKGKVSVADLLRVSRELGEGANEKQLRDTFFEIVQEATGI